MARIEAPAASWATFEASAPDFATAGRRLFGGVAGADGVPIAFLATVGARYHPHLAPVCPIFCGDSLYISAAARTSKTRDLRARGDYVLHALLGPDDEEFQLAGNGAEVFDDAERQAVHAAIPFPAFDRADPIIRLGIERALWVSWERVGQPDTKAIRRRWQA